MNERIEQEIERFLHSEESTTYISSGTFTTAHKDPKKVARHFYNLALQDVLQEVEKEIEGKSFAVKMALLDIGAFIDNLTK